MCRALPCFCLASQAYLDVRDSGVVILTHAYLLLGCALPLWLHLHVLAADDPRILDRASSSHSHVTHAHSTWDVGTYLPALAGVLVLGVGDSMVRPPPHDPLSVCSALALHICV